MLVISWCPILDKCWKLSIISATRPSRRLVLVSKWPSNYILGKKFLLNVSHQLMSNIGQGISCQISVINRMVNKWGIICQISAVNQAVSKWGISCQISVVNWAVSKQGINCRISAVNWAVSKQGISCQQLFQLSTANCQQGSQHAERLPTV